MAKARRGGKASGEMYARAVDDAAIRLRDLRRDELEGLGAGALALALALVATQARPAFALPLFVGGIVVGGRGLVAAVRRWDLVDRLAGEPDAHAIPDVLAYASRETSMSRRSAQAAMLRRLEAAPGPYGARIRLTPELETLAAELADETLELDPFSAVACVRLVCDPDSPLHDPSVSPAVLRARIERIRAGFTPARGRSGDRVGDAVAGASGRP